MKQITLVEAYDWQALYVDGFCVDQGHNISADQVLKLIPNVKKVKWDEDNYSLDDYMPDNLSECKLK